ncbi:MAG: hypothetical protein J6R25_03235 [Bacteroidales bacterium]|nr:hypothetical protein [Bacteroidales bacterium]
MNNRPFSIHPHKGYLNTEITITNTSNADIIIYDNGNRVGTLPPNCLMTSCFSAGAHVITTQEDYLSCLDHDEVYIEDAIKLGGGKIVKGYIFDKSPWIVVKMTDRMYFHNRETSTEYVEMNLVPDEIVALNPDLMLFKTKSEGYSIYSVSSSRMLARFDEEPIFIGDSSIVYNAVVGVVSILYYTDYQIHTIECDKYTISVSGNEIYTAKNDSILVHSLKTDTFITRILFNKTLISLDSNGYYCLLEKSYRGTSLEIKKINLYNQSELKETLWFEPNVIKVGSYLLREDDFIDNLDNAFESLWAQRDRQYKHFISLDSLYCEIQDFYVTDSAVFYKKKITSRSEYGRKQEAYYLCSSSISEPVKIAPYTKVYTQGNSLIFEQSAYVNIICNGTITKISGKLLQHRNALYIISASPEKTSILTLEGNVIYEGNFDMDINVYSLTEKRNVSIRTLDDYGWIIENKNDEKSLFCVFPVSSRTHIKSTPYKSLYMAGDAFVADNSGMMLHINSGHVLPISSEERFNILNVSENGMHLLISRHEELYYINSWEDGLGLLGFHKLDGIEERILEGIFDKTYYTEALFANDGESVVYADSHGKYFLKNLTTNQVTEFDSCKYIKHTNGYTPLLEIRDNRIPRIINPVTGRFVDANLFDFKFSSPDGMWTVVEPDELALDNVGSLECVHKGTRQKLSAKEYNDLRQKLDMPRFISSASPGVRNERTKEMANYPHLFVDELNRRCAKSVAWKRAKINANVIRMYAINPLDVEEISRQALDCFVEYTRVFSKFLVDVTEFIEISNQTSGQIRRINIGIPLWFMNYISFSYDSRYVAMAGRYEDDTVDENRNSLGGLYMLYDLIENKVISKKTNSQAVWVTSFTKEGHIGFYDSHPTTYITNCANEEIVIGGRNFLTFSASGKYFALSNQGYIRYENATIDRPGGHQPSTNVYIRKISSPLEELAQYNDHGDKIRGVMTKKARTVAMVAFSPDDTKLLSISDDGVIVIRNLHLEIEHISSSSYYTHTEESIDDLPF